LNRKHRKFTPRAIRIVFFWSFFFFLFHFIFDTNEQNSLQSVPSATWRKSRYPSFATGSPVDCRSDRRLASMWMRRRSNLAQMLEHAGSESAPVRAQRRCVGRPGLRGQLPPHGAHAVQLWSLAQVRAARPGVMCVEHEPPPGAMCLCNRIPHQYYYITEFI
jgi:hypothetical protein